MWPKNQYQFEPGTYRDRLTEAMVVVGELVTHEWRPLQMDQFEREEPLVVYRDLVMPHEKYIMYSLVLSEFKKKYVKY